MFNESGGAAADVSAVVASCSPNIGGRNSTDAIQYRESASVWAGYYFPRSTIPMFDNRAGSGLHSCRPYIVSGKRRDGVVMLMDESQSRRFAELKSIVQPGVLIPNLVTSDREQAEDFVRQALDRGHEGVMAKARNAAYAAGARGQSWLKVKQARTLDLVVLAAEWGHGRRRGWLSNLHLGARDTEKGGYAMLGKTFKGLTDEMLAWQTEQFLKIEIGRDAYTVYVEPKIVVEVAFNEIQVSPRYPSGLALRFARVKRYRPDKQAGDSDTFETVKELADPRPSPPAPRL